MIPRYLAILFVSIIVSCNGGLAPPPISDKSYIGGIITYVNGKNEWPPADSVIDIRVAAFKVYPPKDIITEITGGNAYFSVPLDMFVNSDTFNLEIPNPPEEIKYIVVAQQYGTIFEWRAIGVWTLTGDASKPSSILIEPGKSYLDLDINVDFKNLPPQPFE